MNIDAYLHRIGLSERPAATLAGLTALHHAHLRSIPYEDLDVQLGVPVTTEIGPIFEKIVTRRRGGWCYEMNGLFGWALGELGFEVTRGIGAVMREAWGEAAVRNHLVLKVALPEGLYLADVGFGDGPLDPIAVREGDFVSNRFTFNLSRIDGDWWRLRHHAYGGAPSFDFKLETVDESALAEKCVEMQTSPQSPFTQNLFCFLFRDGAVQMLRGRVVRMVTPQGFTDRTLDSASELVRFLKEECGLDMPEAASLWPRVCARHEDVLAASAQEAI
jgi:N-hydroxyarylamine O-acetyltransferase